MEPSTKTERGRFVGPLDRISEILFGLIMAVTIIGSLSVATAGRSEVRTVLIGALGCNIAWGLVDAVMYLMRTLTERSRNLKLLRMLAGADTDTGCRLVAQALPDQLRDVTELHELDVIRRALLKAPLAAAPRLGRDDYLAALGIFLLVVLATFPVVLPFVLIKDAVVAMAAFRVVAVAMLFLAGHQLGRYGGHEKPVRTGAVMAIFGIALIAAVMALGG
jgi:hypothetical protein